MKKTFILKLNEYDYDQFDAFVVVAKNKEEAVDIVMREYPNGEYSDCDWDSGYTVEEVDMAESRIILGSFNAG